MNEFNISNKPIHTPEAAPPKPVQKTKSPKALPIPQAAPESALISFVGGATPIGQSIKTRSASQFLWKNIKMGLAKTKVSQLSFPKSSKTETILSKTFHSISATFAKWQSSSTATFTSKTLQDTSAVDLKTTHTIAHKQAGAETNTTVQHAEPVQNVKAQAFDRWRTMRKLENVEEVLVQCQSGRMKPQLKDGKLVAVERDKIGTRKTGQSPKTQDAIAYIQQTIQEGANNNVTLWEEGGKQHNLSDILTQLKVTSSSLHWHKKNPKILVQLDKLEKLVDQATTLGASRAAVVDRLKNISQVLQECLEGDKKPRIGKDGKLTTVDTKKHSLRMRVGKKGESPQTRKAIRYIGSQIQRAAELHIDSWSETGKTVGLEDLLDTYRDVGLKRKWTEANLNFLPAIEEIRKSVLGAVSSADPKETGGYADFSGLQKSYSWDEITDGISGGNSRLSYVLMNSHRANDTTKPLFEHLIGEFIDIADNNKSLDPDERSVRMDNILQFSQDYLRLGISVPVASAERAELHEQLTSLAHYAEEFGMKGPAEELRNLVSSKLTNPPPTTPETISDAITKLERKAGRTIKTSDLIINTNALKKRVEHELKRLNSIKELTDQEKDYKTKFDTQLVKLNASLKKAANEQRPYNFNDKTVEELHEDFGEIMELAFLDIPMNEFDNVTNSKKAYEVTANLSTISQISSNISNAVADAILLSETPQERREAYSKTLHLIDYELRHGNQALALALLAGLTTAPIIRLTEDLQSSKDDKLREKINERLSSENNYKALLAAVEEGLIDGEKTVPFPGMYQTHATQIQENKDTRIEDGKERISMTKLLLQTGLKERISFSQQTLADENQRTHGTDVSNLAALLALTPYYGDDKSRYDISLELKPRPVKKRS